MAKWEREGYCPCQWLKFEDNNLVGLWSLIRSSVVYERQDYPAISSEKLDQMLTTDPIARRVMEAVISRNVNADKILVRPCYNNCRSNAYLGQDVQNKLIEAKNPQLVLASNSEFTVVLADADYGLDLWVWGLSQYY